MRRRPGSAIVQEASRDFKSGRVQLLFPLREKRYGNGARGDARIALREEAMTPYGTTRRFPRAPPPIWLDDKRTPMYLAMPR